MTTVSQEAREAYLSMSMLPEFDAADVRAGRWDNTTGLQAFAKFEQSIRQQADREEEEAHKIGIDEGRQEMAREIDLATGGDGEFRYCMNGDPDRHCPDAEAMKARVLDRFAARHRQSAERGEVVAWLYERKGFAPAVSMRDPRLRYSDIETLHPLYTLPAAPEAGQ